MLGFGKGRSGRADVTRSAGAEASEVGPATAGPVGAVRSTGAVDGEAASADDGGPALGSDAPESPSGFVGGVVDGPASAALEVVAGSVPVTVLLPSSVGVVLPTSEPATGVVDSWWSLRRVLQGEADPPPCLERLQPGDPSLPPEGAAVPDDVLASPLDAAVVPTSGAPLGSPPPAGSPPLLGLLAPLDPVAPLGALEPAALPVLFELLGALEVVAVPPSPPEDVDVGPDPATTVTVDVVELTVEMTTVAAAIAVDTEDVEPIAGGAGVAGGCGATGAGVVSVASAPVLGALPAAQTAWGIDSCATNAATTTPANIPRRLFIPTTPLGYLLPAPAVNQSTGLDRTSTSGALVQLSRITHRARVRPTVPLRSDSTRRACGKCCLDGTSPSAR